MRIFSILKISKVTTSTVGENGKNKIRLRIFSIQRKVILVTVITCLDFRVSRWRINNIHNSYNWGKKPNIVLSWKFLPSLDKLKPLDTPPGSWSVLLCSKGIWGTSGMCSEQRKVKEFKWIWGLEYTLTSKSLWA